MNFCDDIRIIRHRSLMSQEAFALDSEITEKEPPDFLQIRKTLDEMPLTVEALKLWINKTLAEDAFNDAI